MLRKRDYVYTRWQRRKRLVEGGGFEFVNIDTNTARADRPPAKGFVRVNNFSGFAIVRDRPSTLPGEGLDPIDTKLKSLTLCHPFLTGSSYLGNLVQNHRTIEDPLANKVNEVLLIVLHFPINFTVPSLPYCFTVL